MSLTLSPAGSISPLTLGQWRETFAALAARASRMRSAAITGQSGEAQTPSPRRVRDSHMSRRRQNPSPRWGEGFQGIIEICECRSAKGGGLAYMLPCRRFAPGLMIGSAPLGADVVCYSFIVVDFHHLLLAGLPPCRSPGAPDPFDLG
jgi:hypothetical protein